MHRSISLSEGTALFRPVLRAPGLSRYLAAAALTVGIVIAGRGQASTLVPVAASLALLAAGALFILRWRVTGNRVTVLVGTGLLVLGLERPLGAALGSALSGHAGLAQTVEAAAVAAGAWPMLLATLGRQSSAALPGLRACLMAAFLCCGTLAAVPPEAGLSPLVPAVIGAVAVMLWTLVALCALRATPWDAGGRASSRWVSGVGLVVAVCAALATVSAVLPASPVLISRLGDAGMLAAGLTAAHLGVRRLQDALAGQEHYIASLLEQLDRHERHLQRTRDCLHDARSALTGIRATASASRHPSVHADPGARAELVAAVNAEFARLARLLHLPDRPAVPIPCDVEQVIRTQVLTYRERGLAVSWQPTDEAAHLVDGDTLAIIVGNLLGNVHAHAPGASCRITVEAADQLTVTVADDGPGLSAALRDSAFKAGAHRPDSPGEGLGLAIARDLARRHGGDLVAFDAAPGGCFALTLPLLDGPPTERPSSTEAPVASVVPAPRRSADRPERPTLHLAS